MKKTAKANVVPAWDEIENRVIESFNLNDVGTRHGVARWREQVEKVRSGDAAGGVAHAFTSPMVLDAAVEFFKADIAENEAIFRFQLARNARVQQLMNLRVALGEAQGVFVDEEDGQKLVPELLAVRRVATSSATTIFQQVVDASMSLARSNGDENAEAPSWPAGQVKGIEAFAKDLTTFISANGDEGREMVMRVCEDTDFAMQVCNDEAMPNPLRYLARVVAAIATSRLPDKVRRIGFGPDRG